LDGSVAGPKIFDLRFPKLFMLILSCADRVQDSLRQKKKEEGPVCAQLTLMARCKTFSARARLIAQKFRSSILRGL
jgi:hypothetical protein